MVLHYYPDLNTNVVDHHFSKVFSYIKTNEEKLLVIEPNDIPKVAKGDAPEIV